MLITQTEKYKSIDRAIDLELRRKRFKDDYLNDEEFAVPVYVLRLCEKVHHIIGRDDVSLQDVIRVDTYASGHSDYQRKFSLYCTELALYGSSRSGE